MFLPTRPSLGHIDRFLAQSRDLSLSYEPIGLATQGALSFDLDEDVTALGSGEAVFERATRALVDWTHFRVGWVEVFPRRAAIVPGSIVAVLIHHMGFWSLNGCRVVYRVGERSETEFGFAYGTLTNHAEAGEELFKVVFRPESGEVSYSIRAVSRPRALVARLGYPVVRSLQARFRSESARMMRLAVSAAPSRLP
jgi:uncharacterized protein (UPF0548 family)